MEQIGQIINNNQIVGQGQALPVSTPSEDGKSFRVAIRGMKICQLKNPEPIKQALRYAVVLVGLRAANFPNDEEKRVLIEYIQNYYGGHTAAEIKLAFEMAVAGKLNVEQVSCYENFTPLYFSSIMNAYREWAKAESKEVKDEPVQKIYTLDELDDIHRGHVEAFYQRCLKGIILPAELPEYYLTILIKDGYLAEGSDDLHGFFAYWINRGYKNIYTKK